jgi:hypothetical protein
MLPTKYRFIWPSGYRGEDFLEINQSETRIACGGHVCQDWSFCSDPLTNMAATGNSCLLLDYFFKSSRKPIGQMYRNLVGSIYGISSIKIAHFVAIR